MAPLEAYQKYPEHYPGVFQLDSDPTLCAQAYCDAHLGKLIIATAKVLSTTWFKQGLQAPVFRCDWGAPVSATPPLGLTFLNTLVVGQRVYNAGHTDHPAVAWAAQHGGNYDWLYQLGMALLDEFTWRFGRVHAVLPVLQTLELLPPKLVKSRHKFSAPPCVAPAELLVGADPVATYRNYYRTVKPGHLAYSKRRPPDWLADVATYSPTLIKDVL